MNNPRNIKYIAVHCTAGSQRTTIPDLLAVFKSRGFKAPGYHYVISADGIIHQLLSEDQVSNGVKGFNSVSINVAYIGGVISQEGVLKSVDNRTAEQKASLRTLIGELKKRYPQAVIQGHRDFSPDTNGNGVIDPWERIKDCPCFDAKVEYADIK